MKSQAQTLDRQDPLAPYRAQFELPQGMVYLDGNSLGALSTPVKQRMQHVIEHEWGTSLIKGWNDHGWIDLAKNVGSKIGKLIRAEPNSVVCTDSISVNLFKVLTHVIKLSPTRQVIVSTRDNFPTDLYMVQGLQDLLTERQLELRLVEADEIEAAITTEVAAVLLSHVDFRTGQILDMAKLTQCAHEVGALTIWDLAHSAGAIPVDLAKSQVDFAVGCTYKYLNGGPGSPGFVYVAPKHQGQQPQALYGWMGHNNGFAFSPNYQGASDASQYLAGTPPILSLSAVDAALEIFDTISIQTLYQKSQQLQQFFIEAMQPHPMTEPLLFMATKPPNVP